MNINVNNISQHEAIIEIEGTIGIEGQTKSGDDSLSVSNYETFSRQLASIKESGVAKIRVNIRSTGGSVQDALLIHGALCQLQGIDIETHCYGFVASAATIIAQAAGQGKRFVGSTALYLIHNAWTTIDGNAMQAEATASLLDKTDEQIAQIYACRSGYPIDHFRSLMARDAGRGEWLDARQAVALGLADEVENLSPIKNAVDKIRNLLNKLIAAPQWSVQDEVPHEAFLASLTPVEAAKTETLAKDDPKIESDVVSLTANQKSYIQDVELFRD